MKKATVLRAFDISYDGIRSVPAVIGSVIDVPDDAFPGLLAEAYIEAAPEVKTPSNPDEEPEAAEVPENWRDLDYNELRSLASKIKPGEAKNKDASIAIIEAYLAEKATKAGE